MVGDPPAAAADAYAFANWLVVVLAAPVPDVGLPEESTVTFGAAPDATPTCLTALNAALTAWLGFAATTCICWVLPILLPG